MTGPRGYSKGSPPKDVARRSEGRSGRCQVKMRAESTRRTSCPNWLQRLLPPLPPDSPANSPAIRFRPMTLMEIMIASFISMIVIGSALMSLTVMGSAAQLAAQHTAAMSLCQERLEEIRAAPFDELNAESFPTENGLSLTHTESPVGKVLTCERLVDITDDSQPGWQARRVVVTVRWVFRNRPNEERIETIVHEL